MGLRRDRWRTSIVYGLYYSKLLDRSDPVTLKFQPAGGEARDLTIVSRDGDAFVARIPLDAAVGEAEVLAVSASGKTFRARLWIAEANFGIYPEIAGNSLTHPLRPGESMAIFGTGLGANPNVESISIELAGVTVPAEFAAAVADRPGVDQIEFRLPEDAPDDCYAGLQVRVAGRVSNQVSIATAAAEGVCRHRLGLTAGDLATLDAGGTVPIGSVSVTSGISPKYQAPGRYYRFDSLTARFQLLDAFSFATLPARWRRRDLPAAATRTLGFRPRGCPAPAEIDAGRAAMESPNGTRFELANGRVDLSENTDYDLTDVPASPVTHGDWKLTLSGGTDVAAFQLPFHVPPPLRWTDRAPALSNARDYTVRWDPAGYAEGDRAQLRLDAGSSVVECNIAAAAGAITVPAALLGGAQSGSSAHLSLTISRLNNARPRFDAPLVSGGSAPGIVEIYFRDVLQFQIP